MHDTGGHKPILWSPEAVADLDGIWDYYERIGGGHTAENMIRDVYTRCAVLAQHPLAGRSRAEVRADLRSLTTQPFVVFYRVNGDGLPEVARVLDGRQDVDSAVWDQH